MRGAFARAASALASALLVLLLLGQPCAAFGASPEGGHTASPSVIAAEGHHECDAADEHERASQPEVARLAASTSQLGSPQVGAAPRWPSPLTAASNAGTKARDRSLVHGEDAARTVVRLGALLR